MKAKKNIKLKKTYTSLFERLSFNEKIQYFTFYAREFGSYLKKILILFLIFFIISYSFFEKIFKVFSKTIRQNQIELIYSNIFEIFFFRINFSIYLSFIFVFPLIIFYISKFIKPALYKREKKILFCVFSFLTFFFYFSIFLCYKFILPYLFKLIIAINNKVDIKIYLKITDYLSNFLFLSISIGILMQIPILLIFLLKFNFFSVKFLQKNRKIFIMIIFILSGIFTPPDVISQIIFGGIIYLLFEIIILFFKKKGNKSLNNNKNL